MKAKDEAAKIAKTIELGFVGFLLFIVGFSVLFGTGAFLSQDFSPAYKLPLWGGLIVYFVSKARQKKDETVRDHPPLFLAGVTFVVLVGFIVITWFMDYTLDDRGNKNVSSQISQGDQNRIGLENTFSERELSIATSKRELTIVTDNYIESKPQEDDGKTDVVKDVPDIRKYFKGLDAAEKGDFLTAFKIWEPLAKKGHAASQYYLGKMYEKGHAGKQDFEMASKWFTLAAEQGHSSAQSSLGFLYASGKGVAQDYSAAIQWFELAAQQGVAHAQHNLGVMYGGGNGVIQDYEKSAKWYKLAAEQGHPQSQYNLGSLYYKGNGVVSDKVRAYMWWDIVALKGDDKAISNLKVVQEEMTSLEIAEAEELARNCVKKNYKNC